MRIGGLFFFVCLLALNVSGQDVVVKGRVLDSATRKPVSFASVVNPGRGRGTSTSVDGSFSLVVNKLGDQLQVSSIGYKKRSWKSAEGFNEIYLSPSNANMEAIVIKPNDIQDPLALRIIRKAIDNKKINDPEELGSFSYNTYSKGIVDTLQGDK
ncbi:MAG: carboxypeptidase-like regulatory domain-containing protein, partial [Sphingobacteriales bacterium]